MSTAAENPLKDALEKLEAQLETPTVAGELVNWLEAASSLWQELRAPLQNQIEHVHSSGFKRIRKDDPDLLRRVEQMQEQDEQLLNQLAEHQHTFAELYELAVKTEPNETKVIQHVVEANGAGIQYVIDVRKQERALETWMQEAEFRDSGVSG